MRFENIDLNLFVVFDVIYREGSLTRAAEVLSITQPAVSNALLRLRERLDDPLFVRSGRAMVPTAVAQNMIVPVRQALRQLQLNIEDRESFRPHASERIFTLSLSDIAASMLLPELLRRTALEAPRIRLRCFQIDRKEIATEMAAGRLDLAVDVPQVAAAALDQVALMQDRFVCVLRPEHPLAGKELTLERFMGLHHVTVSSRRRGGGFVEAALSQIGKRLFSPLRLQTYQPALHAVQNSDLALSAPLSLVRRYQVAQKELPFQIAPLVSCLFWHRTANNDPANRWLRGHLIAAAEGLS
jgi:DNA-binding transcriptional LysR family regulator